MSLAKQCHAMNEYYLTGQWHSHTPILKIKGLLKLGQGELLTSNLSSLTTLPLAVSYSYSLSKFFLLLHDYSIISYKLDNELFEGGILSESAGKVSMRWELAMIYLSKLFTLLQKVLQAPHS